MHPHRRLFFLSLVITAATAHASSCRSADAAQAGAAAGLARDQDAAAAAAVVQEANSDILGKCITGVTSINLVPAFPSLQDIFQAAVDKICKEASDKIAGITSTLPTTPGMAPAPVPAFPSLAASPSLPATGLGVLSSRASDFWRALWR